MKLGPNLRKKQIAFHEFLRKTSPFIEYFLWLLLDPSKYVFVNKNKIKKILFVLINEDKGNVGGDFCLLGALNFFKLKYPNVDLNLLADKGTIGRFGKVNGLNQIIYEGRHTLDQLKKEKFDAAVFIYTGPLWARDFTWIPYRFSTFYPSVSGILNWKSKFFITRKALIPWGKHMVDFEFDLFEKMGFKFKERKVILQTSKAEEKKISDFVKSKKLDKFIILHPGGKFVVETLKRGKWPPHLWPLDRYAKLADYFSKKGYKIVITGSKEESYLAEQIASKSKSSIINCCGLFSIRELGAFLKRTRLLIATDTSIVHVAYQVGCKIVALFGPSCPEVSGPWPLNSLRHRILVDKGPCSRSMKKIECPEDLICMDHISLDQVISSSEQLLV